MICVSHLTRETDGVIVLGTPTFQNDGIRLTIGELVFRQTVSQRIEQSFVKSGFR
jgi:hypothetical protein